MRSDSSACACCGAPLVSDQRYCLSCGERAGAPGPLLVELLRRRAPSAPEASSTEPVVESKGALSAVGVHGGLRLPRARVSALLVLAFLGFGAILGSAAGSGTRAARPHLKLVLAPASAVAGPTTASASEGSEGASEPPPVEAEATPQPASEAPTKTAAAPAEAKSKSEGSGEAPATKLPAIKHVFLIVLSNQPYAADFGPESKAAYLAHTLERKGELLVRYDAIAHEQLANGIALLSGQGPTPQTSANCPVYADLLGTGMGADGQALGEGCVYPASTKTLPGQLSAKHLAWRAYVQGIDEGGSTPEACAHPSPGAPDPSSDATPPTGPYATFRNPLVYFHSIVDSPSCATRDVGLSRLKSDLANPSRTPSFAYIAPDRCHDGNPTPCSAGAAAGPASADGVLQQIVPEIMASPAYKQGGLIAITIDEAPSRGEYGDSSSCCGQPAFPNMAAAPTSAGAAARGGGAVGALLISPFVKPGGTSQEPYDHFSLLRTIEDLFKLPHLGYAALAGVKPLAPALFTAKKAGG